MNGLKAKLKHEFEHQNSNDPIIHPIVESEYGSIEVRFEYHVGNGIETIGSVEVIPNEGFDDFARTSSSLKEDGEFEADEDVIGNLHEFILKYLKNFENERSLMVDLGFECMGYDWYRFNDLHVIKLLKDGNLMILIGTKVDDAHDTSEWEDPNDDLDLLKALKLYGSDLSHYLLLPPKVRDMMA